MDTRQKRFQQKIVATVDDWLKEEGYFRKASPKDPTCLFRAVSEQIYMTQYYHIKVRKECVSYMRKHKYLFEKDMVVPIDNYLEQLSMFTEWGSKCEIEAMSRLYKKEFIIFNSIKMTKNAVTNNGFNDFIYLCFTPPRHYECVYERKTISSAAFCQSIVYKLLYGEVFEMPNIDQTVERMLHESTEHNNHHNKYVPNDENFGSKEHSKMSTEHKKSNEDDNKNNKCRTVAPFAYRIAKALDPNIYRNIDLDIWQEMKRELRNARWLKWNNCELQVGGKCLVQINHLDDYTSSRNLKDIDNNGNITQQRSKTSGGNKDSIYLVGHIQEMSQNEGPVVVFIEELGEKKTVPYQALKPLQESQRNKMSTISSSNGSVKNNNVDQNPRWRKQMNLNTRKSNYFVTNPTNTHVSKSHRDLNVLDNENNNNYNNINNENDNIDSGNVKQSGLEAINDCNNSEKTDGTNINNEMNMENYPPPQQYPINNVMQIQPLMNSPESSVPEQLENNFTARNVQKNINNLKHSHTNSNEKNLKHHVTDNNGNNMQTPETLVPVSTDGFCSPNSPAGTGPMYPGNLNIVCVSPDGNVYAPFFYFGNNFSGSTPAGLSNCNNQLVNYGVPLSVDANGNDLPYSDIPTMRFFFNLGVEYFRFTQSWTPNPVPPQMPCTQPFLTNEENFVPPMGVPCHANSSGISIPNQNAKQQQQTDNNDVARNSNSPVRRKHERTINYRVNSKTTGNIKNFNSRKFNSDYHQQDLNKHRTIENNSYDHQKPKYLHANNENRGMNGANTDTRKNRGGNGQYKKSIEDRNRTDGRFHGHYEHQKPSSMSVNNHIINNDNSGNINNNCEDNKFATKSKASRDHQGRDHSNQIHKQQTPPTMNRTVSSFTQQSPPLFTGVPYYPNDVENVYPLSGNMYPVSYLPPSDAVDGNNMAPYYCTSLDNCPQPITSVYSPIPFTPSPVLTSPPPPPPLQPIFPAVVSTNSSENWYIPGQPHFISYPQPYPVPPSSSVALPLQSQNSPSS